MKSLRPRKMSTPLNFAEAGFSSITSMKVSKCCGHKVLTRKGKSYFSSLILKLFFKNTQAMHQCNFVVETLPNGISAHRISKTLLGLSLSFHIGNCFSLYRSKHSRPSHVFFFIMPPSFLSVNSLSSTLAHLPSPWNPTLPTKPLLDVSSRLWTGSKSNKELRNFEGQNSRSSSSRGGDSSGSCGNILARLFLHKYVAVFPASWLPSELPCFLVFPMSLSCSHWLYELLAFPWHVDKTSVNSVVPLTKIGGQLSFGCFLNAYFSIFLT